MSLQHWAIEAVLRHKTKPTVPGSSHHILLELQTNLVVARDGVLTFNLLLDSCTSSLNSIIDLINNKDASVISKISQLNNLKSLPEFEDSFSRNSSSLSRSRQTTEEPIRMELALEQSEKRFQLSKDKPHEKQQNESIASGKMSAEPLEKTLADILNSINLQDDDSSRSSHVKEPNLDSRAVDMSASRLEVVHEHGLVTKLTPKIDANGEKRALANIAKSFRFQSSPKPTSTVDMGRESPRGIGGLKALTENAAQSLKRTDQDSSEAGLSPVQLVSALAPTTSPNANLSFIPITKTINPKGPGAFVDRVNNQSSDTEADLSFKAISTAIRKSFAGNQSMAHNPQSTIVYKSDRDIVANGSRSLPSEKLRVKNEISSVVAHSNDVLRRTIETSKRTSVFVSLPDREPISFRNTARKSITIKKENSASSSVSPLNKSNGQMESHSTQERLKSTELSEAKTLTVFSKNLRSRTNHTSPLSTGKKLSSKENDRSGILIGKPKSRTTTNGSPRRVELPPLRRNIDLNLSPSKRGSPEALKTSPPKKASRSPVVVETHRRLRDYAPTRKTPTTSPGRSPMKLPEKPREITTIRSKSSSINKFLVTKLNPKNPPTFVPPKVSEQKQSPQETSSRTTFSNIPDLQRSPTEKFKTSLVKRSGVTSPLNGVEFLSKSYEQTRTDRSPRSLEQNREAKAKTPLENRMSKVVPRRRAMGNAIPLPEAARGKFVRDRPRERALTLVQKTPQRTKTHKLYSSSKSAAKSSPVLTTDGLPDIPSDDEILRKTKYIKSWAETPEIIRTLNENPPQDPRAIFGEFPVLNINEVFSSVTPSKGGDK